MSRISLINTIGASAILMAADNAAGSGTTAAAKPKAAPVITVVSADVPQPERASKRGSVSVFPFDALTAVGMSFGVKDRTAKSLSSIVSSANRKNLVNKTDANGAVIYKMNELKDAAGNVVGSQPDTTKPEKVAAKKFYAVDVDAKKDPHGASVRVFREL